MPRRISRLQSRFDAQDESSSSKLFASFRSSVSKPSVNQPYYRSEQVAGLLALALIAPEPRHAHRRAQFPGLCSLLVRDCECAVEIGLRFRGIRLWRFQHDFSGEAIDLGLEQPLLGYFDRGHRLGDTVPSVTKLAEFRGARQI